MSVWSAVCKALFLPVAMLFYYLVVRHVIAQSKYEQGIKEQMQREMGELKSWLEQQLTSCGYPYREELRVTSVQSMPAERCFYLNLERDTSSRGMGKNTLACITASYDTKYNRVFYKLYLQAKGIEELGLVEIKNQLSEFLWIPRLKLYSEALQ